MPGPLAVVLAVAATFCSVGVGGLQEPQSPRRPDPAPTVADLRSAVDQSRAPGEAGEAARHQLDTWVERDYPAVFAAWEQEPPGPRREALDLLLGLPAVRAATVVVRGVLERVETVQGGVVDYHHVNAHFAAPEVLRASGDDADALRCGYLTVVAGTSRDAWLAQLLREHLEPHRGDAVWLFRSEELLHAKADAGALGPTSLRFSRWQRLPASAAPCLQRLLR